MSNQEAIRNIIGHFEDTTGNLQQYPGVYPDTPGPVIKNNNGRRTLDVLRWGLPAPDNVIDDLVADRIRKLEAKGKPFDCAELRRIEPNRGTTNIRRTQLPHWQQFLDVGHRAVIPFTSFAEPQKIPGKDIGGPPVWFAFDKSRPLAFFAGAWANWTGVRKVREGVITTDLYAFLTTKPNAEIFKVHEKAMPVILRTKEEVEIWLTTPWNEAKELQRPLPDGSLTIVAEGGKTDAGSE